MNQTLYSLSAFNQLGGDDEGRTRAFLRDREMLWPLSYITELQNLEAARRIELPNKDFAGLDLTTWLRRLHRGIYRNPQWSIIHRASPTLYAG